MTFELEHDSEIIADNLKIKGTADRSGIAIVEEIMRDIIEIGLFTECQGRVFCLKLLKRINLSMTSSPAFRDAINQTKTKYHDTIMTHHDGIMLPTLPTNNTKQEEEPPASPPFPPEPSTFKMPWDDEPTPEPKKAKPVTTAPGAGSQRIEAARQIWNTTDGLPQYRYLAVSIPPDKSGPILRMMGAYADDDIYKAIANYADILGRTDLEAFPRYTGFPGFMATGVEAYCDDAKPYERCKKRATPERYSKPGALDDRPDAMTSADIERMQRETDSEEYAEISAEMFAGKTPA